MWRPVTVIVWPPGKFTVPRKLIAPAVTAPVPSRVTLTVMRNAPLALGGGAGLGFTSPPGVKATLAVKTSALAGIENASSSSEKSRGAYPTVLFIICSFRNLSWRGHRQGRSHARPNLG